MEIPKIVSEIPGPKSREILKEAKELLATTTRGYSIVIEKAENELIYDVDGNTFIDFAAGIAVANVGHRNPEVIEAIKNQLDLFIHSAPHDFYDIIQYKAAKKLLSIIPISGAKKVFFGNSGTEAVEASLKIARKYTKRPVFVSFIRAFHGRTFGSLSLTASKTVHRKNYFPLLPNTYHFPYAYCYRCPFGKRPENCNVECLWFLEEALDTFLPPDDVAAIIVEPIQGEGGYIVPPKKFFERLWKIARTYNILLIVDEVQTGFARTGKMFAIEHFGVNPDIMTMAKAIANGLPLGATTYRAELDFPEPGAHSSTFGGNALSLAAMIAVIDYILRNNLAERAEKLGKKTIKFLKDLQEESKTIGDVRGLGLMIGVEFVRDKETKEYNVKIRDKIVEISLKKGLILLPAGKSAIRIAPPLTIREEFLEKGLEIFAESIKIAEKGLKWPENHN